MYIASLIGLLITSFFSVGYHHPDEHYQILEFAGLKLGLTEAVNLPWEYHFQIRPTAQPAFVVFLSKGLGILGITSPFTIAWILRILSSVFAFFVMKKMYETFKETVQSATLKHFFLLFSMLLWFNFYLGSHFSSENWSGLLFVLAFTLYHSKEYKTSWFYLVLGLLMGTSFIFRYQAGLLIAGFVGWILFIKKDHFSSVLEMVSGILIMAGVGILIDFWFYGEWTLSTWNYIDQNLIQDKVSSFGVDPWWYYFGEFFVQGSPPLSILLLLATLATFVLKPKSAITWSLFPFLLIHFLIGHKELRFLFPMLFFFPLLLMEGIQAIETNYQFELSAKKSFRFFLNFCFGLNLLFLSITLFKSADSDISLYQSIYNNYESPTSLFYMNENPYLGTKDIYYYRRNNLEFQQIESLQEVNMESGKNAIVIFNSLDNPAESNKDYVKVYTSLPKWVLRFNFNNWQERTSIWSVYEYEPSNGMGN